MTNRNDICDVAIVGGGPAGATAAYILAGQGLDTRLIDKQPFPRPKLCAGLLTWKTIRILNEIFGDTLADLKKKHIIVHACRNYQIFYCHKQIAEGTLAFPFHFTHRSDYDQHWLAMARSNGARVTTGIPVSSVAPDTGAIQLADGKVIQSKIIIGADGVWSKVRHAMPQQRNPKVAWRKNMAATIETYHDYDETFKRPGLASLHFGFVSWGYCWSFPGQSRQTLGMGALTHRHDGSIRHSFLGFADSTALRTDKTRDLRGYPLPYGNYLHNPVFKKTLLVGDACGLADPLLGEGIFYAHRSAQIAAEAILDARLDWQATAGLYRRRLKRHIIKEFKWIKLFRDALFLGGCCRRYRGLKLFFLLMPKRLEAAVQGQLPFSKLLLPWFKGSL